jgi:DNA-binding MarR family transcriptional regulator
MAAHVLLAEASLLSEALTRWREALHEGREITVPSRAVLERVLLGGSATVPEMARARGVSRQHIQQQVDALLDRGLLERQKNPAHRRSSVIALTDKGRALIQSVRADELDALGRMQVGVSDHAISEAVLVLSAWRAALRQDVERRAQ